MTRIAVLQMTSGIDPVENARHLATAAAQASANGAAMLFTPEMTGLIDRDRKRSAAKIVAEGADPTLAAACDAARRHRIGIALGSLAVTQDDVPGKFANRSFVVTPDGQIAARYDKIHLFDVDLPTGERWRESEAYAGGDAAILVGTPAGRLGLTICYDLRFPALFTALAGAGAEVLAVPAAFTVPTGQAHWHILLRARAIETGSFVVAAAQVGRHADGRDTYGHSLVVDPWGRVLLDMWADATEGAGAPTAAPQLGYADIDLRLVTDARARIPTLKHRRDFTIPG